MTVRVPKIKSHEGRQEPFTYLGKLTPNPNLNPNPNPNNPIATTNNNSTKEQ
jgi:hypothetical protein